MSGASANLLNRRFPSDAPTQSPAGRFAVDGIPSVWPLQGHSGARLTLRTDRQASIVRKTAGSPARAERLRLQSEKQRLLSQYGIPLPRVLSEGVDEDGLAYFDMDYIPARTVAATICEAAPFDQPAALRAIERALGFFRLTQGAPIPAGAFKAKILEIAGAARRKGFAQNAALGGIASRLNAMDWDGIPSSLDHGDMTLENILLCQRRGPVFIDCDVCWVSSYWLDIAKLYQDAAGHWCLRALYLGKQTGPRLLNATQRLERFAVALHESAAGLAPGLHGKLPQLTALHLFRTLPYAGDAALAAFVLKRISSVLSRTGL